MSEGPLARRPQQVVAALKIAEATRHALADGMEQHDKSGWDFAVLLHELARTLGACLRVSQGTPAQLDALILTLQRVYAGISSSSAPSIEEALQHLCPEADVHEESATARPEDAVVQ